MDQGHPGGGHCALPLPLTVTCSAFCIGASFGGNTPCRTPTNWGGGSLEEAEGRKAKPHLPSKGRGGGLDHWEGKTNHIAHLSTLSKRHRLCFAPGEGYWPPLQRGRALLCLRLTGGDLYMNALSLPTTCSSQPGPKRECTDAGS